MPARTAATTTSPEAASDASGICPAPPLVTGKGTPLAPSYLEAIALGNEHSCLLLDGEVWCWGQNFGGELGDGTQASRARPTQVSGVTKAVAIESGPAFDYGCNASRGSHTFALLDDATVTCWGSNVSGDSSWIVQSFVPTPIAGLTDVTAMGIAGYGNCAVLPRWKCASSWGVNPAPVPAIDGGLDDIANLAAGYGIVAAGKDGTVWSWTASSSMGITTVAAPTRVSGLGSIAGVAAGWGHQCALKSDGTVWCWGINYHGQVGDGTTTDRATPVQVPGVAKAAQVVAGGQSTCALISDGSVMCWGDNTYGQIGLGTSGGDVPSPVVVPALTQVRQISIGVEHACAVRWDLSVWCWGGNEAGQVGDGATIDRPAPVQVYP